MQRNSSTKVLVAVAAVLVVLGIGLVVYAFSTTADEPAPKTESASRTPASSKSTSKTPTGDTQTAGDPTIVFTDDGFEKRTYTYPAGTKIRVENKSSMDMQFSSDDHPTHRDHPELNLGILGAGESATFTPAGKGTYGFHDHINDQYEGTLIIE